MIDKQFIFLAGLHRSGTSMLHEVLRTHTNISGIHNSGVPEDEGQHIQSVYQSASCFGGPGKFVFDQNSHMNESHLLATEGSSERIFEQWSSYFDLSCDFFIEKSPPNIVRTRFLQKLYPNSKFVVILRHPLAVAYATQKWSKTTIKSLADHSLLAYETLLSDMDSLNSCYVLRYEDFVKEPQNTVDDICKFIGIDTFELSHSVRTNVNEKYFDLWKKEKKSFKERILMRLPLSQKFEERANRFGYSFDDVEALYPASILANADINN